MKKRILTVVIAIAILAGIAVPVRAEETVPEEAVFIRSTDVCKLLNISNSTLRNMRAEHAIPFYKLGGIFLYSKEEIMNYLASNYSRRI